MRLKLTDAAVQGLALEAGTDDLIAFDTKLVGFGFRLRRGKGEIRKTWLIQYRDAAKKSQKFTLGTVQELKSAAKARETAAGLLAGIRLGTYPNVGREKRRLDAEGGVTFGDAVTTYLSQKKSDLRPRSYLEVERHLLTHAASLHDKPLASIDRADVSVLFNRVVDGSGPVAANRTRASLSAFFAWAMRNTTTVIANPVLVDRRDETPRNRVLSNSELRDIWQALDSSDYGDILRLLMLSGQRREEIGGLRWTEVDFERGVVVLPPERQKNNGGKDRLDHEVPMSDPVTEILKARVEKRVGERMQVFGQGQGGFSGWSNCKEALDQRIAESRQKALGEKAPQMPPWVLHDVRRSVATRMSELGVLPHVVETVLNHVGGFRAGVAGTYNKALYAAEKAAALVRWADHVMALVSDTKAKVVSLHGNRIPA